MTRSLSFLCLLYMAEWLWVSLWLCFGSSTKRKVPARLTLHLTLHLTLTLTAHVLSVVNHFKEGRGWRDERQTRRELYPNKSLFCSILVTDDIRFNLAILVLTGSGGMGGMGMGGGGGMPDGFNFDDFDKVYFLLLNVC